MKTKNEYLAEAKKENPKPLFFDANGVAIQLTDDEYEAAINAWAEMRVAQDAAENAAAQLIATKRSAYSKLGLTADEIEALLD